MSTIPKSQQPTPAPVAAKKTVKTVPAQKEIPFLFNKENYIFMIGAAALIFIGFLLMSGGRSTNPHEFHYDEIFSFRRITLAPIVIMMGYITAIYAIMKKPKEQEQAIQE